MRIGFQNGNKLFYYGNIGLTASFLTHAAVNSPVFNENLEVISNDKFDLTDQIATIELAAFLEVGGGYMLNKQFGIFAEGSFCHGFSSLTSSNFFADNTLGLEVLAEIQTVLRLADLNGFDNSNLIFDFFVW